MNSLDTNILMYATNQSCNEHQRSREVYQELLNNPTEWIIADQVLFEFYRSLRNPKVLEYPLSHTDALAQVRFLREEVGCLHCAYSCDEWSLLVQYHTEMSKKSKHIFDLVLAVTLKANNVNRFYSRNVSDFANLNLFEVINPLDASDADA